MPEKKTEVESIADALNNPAVDPIIQGSVALICLHGILASVGIKDISIGAVSE